MSDTLRIVVILMGVGRAIIGLAPFFAAGMVSRALGFPAAHDTPTARLMARMFGVRDVGLGVLAWFSVGHLEAAPFLLLFNAAMDGGDLFSTTIPLLRRQGIDRAAIASTVMALVGGMAWIIAYFALVK